MEELPRAMVGHRLVKGMRQFSPFQWSRALPSPSFPKASTNVGLSTINRLATRGGSARDAAELRARLSAGDAIALSPDTARSQTARGAGGGDALLRAVHRPTER